MAGACGRLLNQRGHLGLVSYVNDAGVDTRIVSRASSCHHPIQRIFQDVACPYGCAAGGQAVGYSFPNSVRCAGDNGCFLVKADVHGWLSSSVFTDFVQILGLNQQQHCERNVVVELIWLLSD
jgi:hypothetical protein